MAHITFDVPEGVLATLHQAQPEFTKGLRLAAAVKWYERSRQRPLQTLPEWVVALKLLRPKTRESFIGDLDALP